jgi:hypothetical protein
MNPMERAIARSAHGLNEADRLAGLPPRYAEDPEVPEPDEGDEEGEG